MAAQKFNKDVFINCPFDKSYKLLFNAIVFAVFDCSFAARCALEEDDGSQIRVQKIFKIISECRLSIHDLSRVEIDRSTKLPRFNMPLELGVFLGAKHFGGRDQKSKACLILDAERYRYQKFISDIAGQDIKSHENNPRIAIRVVRDWLRTYSKESIPSGSVIWSRYQRFEAELPLLCKELKLNRNELIFNDYVMLVFSWLRLTT
jgi:hypothetical protein